MQLGGGYAVAVQSMCATRTQDVDATVEQAEAIRKAGGDIVRVAVDNAKDVEARAVGVLAERADEVLLGPRESLGPPWTKDHRMALAATIVAESNSAKVAKS